MAFSKQAVEDSMAAAKDLAASKSVMELMEKQAEYAKASFDTMMKQATKMNEMYMAAAKETMEPINARFTAAADMVASGRSPAVVAAAELTAKAAAAAAAPHCCFFFFFFFTSRRGRRGGHSRGSVDRGSTRPTRRRYSKMRVADPPSTCPRLGRGPPHRRDLMRAYAGHSVSKCATESASSQFRQSGFDARPISWRVFLVSTDLPTLS